jgi:malonate decarboxylase epsilon subunit
MAKAYPTGFGMTAITGLTRQQLEPLLAQVHAPGRPVYLANLNALRQIVISGADHAMQAVSVQALEHGALRAERLAVSVPSHCELFAHEAQQLAAAMSKVALQRPRMVFISSSTGRALFDARRIGEDLAANMACPVLWHDAVRHAWERGARLAVEMPSGSVLSKLTQPVFHDGLALCWDGNRLDTLTAEVARESAH